jgi:hypothetical protein
VPITVVPNLVSAAVLEVVKVNFVRSHVRGTMIKTWLATLGGFLLGACATARPCECVYKTAEKPIASAPSESCGEIVSVPVYGSQICSQRSDEILLDSLGLWYGECGPGEIILSIGYVESESGNITFDTGIPEEDD